MASISLTAVEENRRSTPFAGDRIALGLLAVFVLAVHAPLGAADFSLDDRPYVMSNPSIRTLPEAFAAFGEPFPPQTPALHLYRPITNLSYAVDYALWGLVARGYHASNVILYGLVVWLVYALARHYALSRRIAFGVALLFAAHPVHCEAVDSITGRIELLSLGFCVVSLLAFLRHLRSPSAVLLGGAVLAYALACGSKETGAVLPAVLAVHFLAYGRRAGEAVGSWLPRCAWTLAPFVAVGIGYLTLRALVLESLTPEPILAGMSLAFRIHTIGMAFFQYVGLLVFPAVLQVDYYWGQFFQKPRETLLLAGVGWLLASATFAGGAALLWRLISRPEASPVLASAACGLAVFVGFLLPVSHLFPISALMAERMLFSPSLGFCVLAVVGGDVALRRWIPRDTPRRRVAALLLALLALAGGVRSHLRALEWRDDLQLWRSADRALPDDARVLTYLALAHLERKRLPEARVLLERARSAEPRLEGLTSLQDRIEDGLRRAELEAQRSRSNAWESPAP